MIIQDQLKRSIRLGQKPKRIVCLVPSITELLAYFKLDDEVVGITKFCIHPKNWHQDKTRIGGTKQVNFEKIEALNPDLILGNKEENTPEIIQELEQKYPVFVTDIVKIEDAYDAIRMIGQIVNKIKEAESLVEAIQESFQSFKKSKIATQLKGKKVIYCIWENPTFVVGKETYIDSVLTELGLANCIQETRYPEINDKINPDFILLSSEPFPYKEKHMEIYKNRFPNAQVLLVDGEIFSWYGPKMKNIIAYIEQLFSHIH